MLNTNSQDILFMRRAIELAQQAKTAGEVPVGAVAVIDNEIVGTGFNCPIGTCDPTAHAEIIALKQAAQKLNNYRLPEVTLYVTLEPCVMCVGAMLHARIKRLVFGATDPKTGAVTSVFKILDSRPRTTHFLKI
jgi:tRNA(adenine34) deaminase